MNRHRLAASTALALTLIASSAAEAQTSATGAETTPATPAGPTPAAQPSDAQSPANDSGQLGEIIVTATKRETSLEKTPIAISAFDQKQLDQFQVKDVTQLAQFVPSLAFNQQGDQSAITLTLRGIGNDSAYTEVADPEVAIYVDGVYSPRAQGAALLAYDLERLDVLRGPQGTLFGRNATVGAIQFETAKPTFDGVHGYGEVLGGSYNRFGSQGMINIPVSDTLAIRAAFITDRHDGYIDFQQPPASATAEKSTYVTQGKKYYAGDQKSARLSVEWRPSDRFRWDINGEYYKDTGAPILGLMQDPRAGEKFWSALIDTAPEQDRYDVSIRSTMSYDLTDNIQIDYIAGWNRLGGSTAADADAGTEPPSATDPDDLPVGAFEENRTISSRYDFNSHEIQIKSIGTHPIDWIVGGYFSHEDNRIRFDIDTRNGYRDGTFNYAGSFIQAKRTVDSKAGFGQAVWHVTDHVRLTGGIRYTDDDKRDVGGRNVTASGPCAPSNTAADGTCAGLFGAYPNASAEQLATLLGFDILPNDTHGNWDKITWLARADADITRTTFGYASISTGFKSGNIEDGGLLAGPETLTNYEIGLKQRFLDGRATLNVAAYYSDFKGYQVNQAVTMHDDPTDPTKITGSQIVTTNAKGATAKGIELELNANATRHDHIQIAADVQKTRFKTLLTADGRLYNASDPASVENLEGNELPHAPRFAITGTYIHDFELPNGALLSPRATVHYETRSWLTYFNGDVASRYDDPTGKGTYGTAFDEQKAYARVDLALSYSAPNGRYVIEAFGQNITDKRIRISSGAYGATSNPPVFLSNYAPPRTWGGRIRFTF